jgi:hypothetical protein
MSGVMEKVSLSGAIDEGGCLEDYDDGNDTK